METDSIGLLVVLLSSGLAAFVLLCGILIYYALTLHKKLNKTNSDLDPFRNIINIQAEENRLDGIIYEKNYRIENLKRDYHTGKETYDRLQAEIANLNENLEEISMGVYQPHYTYEMSEQYKEKLDEIYSKKRILIKENKAVVGNTNWTVNGDKREGTRMIKQHIKLMLKAFNGESDAAIAKVSWNNVYKMIERIKKAHEAINTMCSVHNIRITEEYLKVCIEELRLSYEYERKKYEEKEEQRQIREQMREEERAIREYEKAQREAALEQEQAQKALEQARAELQKASGEHLEAIQEKVRELEQKVVDAQAKQDRAVSMAQITKMGHVYVISNIGSFGEDVFKIGMTRRLEPEDRIRELGGASVPFAFDTHAMVFSEDAPALENAFHREFSSRRLNLVNPRKEYFRVSLDEIEAFAQVQGVSVEFTKLAEARHYRESEAIRMKAQQDGKTPIPAPALMGEKFPEELFAEVGED